MISNFGICPHCALHGQKGIVFLASKDTPLISRSDGESFHLWLAIGPDIWYAKDGSPVAGRMATNFQYAADKQGIAGEQVSVVLRTYQLNAAAVQTAVRDVADILAEMIASGKRLATAYFYDNGTLRLLHKDDRP
jgi:hypothetical protein